MARRLLLLNGLAAFSVATFHAAAYGFNALFDWTNRYMPVSVPDYSQLGSLSYYALLFIRSLDGFAIPAFIFVTGYFVAFLSRGNQLVVNHQMVLPRIRAFLAPFILWTAVRFLLLRQIPNNLDEILGTYYYIVLAIQFYLLAPILVPFVKKSWKIALLVAWIIEVVTDGMFLLNYFGFDSPLLLQIQSVFPLWFFPRRIFSFVLGLAVGLNQDTTISWLRTIKWQLAIATVALLILSLVEYELFDRMTGPDWIGSTFRGVSNRVYSILFILSFLVIDIDWIPISEKILYLGRQSFGIYLANIPIIYLIAVLIYRYAPWILGNQWLYQGILVSAGLGVPLFLMELVSLSRARPYYKYVFG